MVVEFVVEVVEFVVEFVVVTATVNFGCVLI